MKLNHVFYILSFTSFLGVPTFSFSMPHGAFVCSTEDKSITVKIPILTYSNDASEAKAAVTLKGELVSAEIAQYWNDNRNVFFKLYLPSESSSFDLRGLIVKVSRSAGAEKKSENFKGKIEDFVVDSMPGPKRSLSKQKIECEVEL